MLRNNIEKHTRHAVTGIRCAEHDTIDRNKKLHHVFMFPQGCLHNYAFFEFDGEAFFKRLDDKQWFRFFKGEAH